MQQKRTEKIKEESRRVIATEDISGITKTPTSVQEKETRDQRYEKFVTDITPKFLLGRNMWRAFWTGGTVCLLGQIVINIATRLGQSKENAAFWSIILLVGASIVLTGFQIYGTWEKYAGAGFLVPITGFANSVASPALEYQCEGEVFGTGCKIFTIAGPVILYGLLSSGLLGVIYYLMQVGGLLR